jgi:hypothetical protein
MNFNGGFMFRKTTAAIAATVLLIFGVACSSSSFSGFFKLQGKVFLPARVVQSLSRVEEPVTSSTTTLETANNAEFAVLDFEKPADDRVVATGTTDANGNYEIDIEPTSVAAVIISSSVRVSGLLNPVNNVSKDFNGTTDVACEAGVSAIVDGSVTPEQMTAQRIKNLEDAAALISDEVDFTDPLDVSAAAAVVRAATNDGANSAF